MKKIIFLLYILFTTVMFASNITLSKLENNSEWSRIEENNVVYYTKKDYGRVPILCFHMINDEYRYGLTAKKFEDLLIYLNNNKFYLISDKDFLNKDLSKVPTGYTPIVLGADDASEGNFLYETDGSVELGNVLYKDNMPVIKSNTMLSLLEKHIVPENGKINFTYYVAFKGMPFQQTGGSHSTEPHFRGYPILKEKLNYLLDNFYVGVHTITHPVTKNTSSIDFKWELEEFFKVMESYVGDRISLINTLAYPHGCAVLKPEMRFMLKNFKYKDVKLTGGFDFDGYFSKSPYHKDIDYLDVSRIGVDNKNIDKIYGFLENLTLFKTTRVIVVKDKSQLKNIKISDQDYIMVVK